MAPEMAEVKHKEIFLCVPHMLLELELKERVSSWYLENSQPKHFIELILSAKKGQK